MKIVRVRDERLSSQTRSPLAAALGSFDGLHLGHRRVLDAVSQSARARGLTPALITFMPHPSVGLKKIRTLPLITPFRQRVRLLASLGIEQLVTIAFTERLGALSWQDFCERYILGLLNVRLLVIGPDARVGHRAEGTAPLLEEFLEKRGCAVDVLSFANEDSGKKIASRAIREFITAGEILEAEKLLGRRFTISGRIVHGSKRGRGLGAPTANLHVPHQVIPKDGVYCGFATVDGRTFEAVCNIGDRPTFSGGSRAIEVHLLDAGAPDLYGARLDFSVIERLRDEKKFESAEALASQIQADIAAARAILGRARG